jgi:hypothetical protein
MDSTLPPDSVKEFILRGAREPRLNATNGSVARFPVQNAPEEVYELDVYGALTVLAREDATTPICGFPVYSIGDSIRLERGGIHTTHIGLPGMTFLSDLTVAQGGRLLAAVSDSGVVQFNHRGTRIGPPLSLSVRHRTFLERDTADWLQGDTLVLRPAGTTVSLKDRLASGWSVFVATDVSVSPIGEWATAAYIRWQDVDPPATLEVNNVLFPVGGGPVTTVTSSRPFFCTQNCPTSGSDAGWSNDARRVVYPVAISDNGQTVRTDLYNILVSGGNPSGHTSPVPVGGRRAGLPWFFADDSVVVMTEEVLSSGDCQRTMREAANIGNVFFDVLSPADCEVFRRAFNGHPVATATLPPATRLVIEKHLGVKVWITGWRD